MHISVGVLKRRSNVPRLRELCRSDRHGSNGERLGKPVRPKCALGPDGLVHEFTTAEGEYKNIETRTDCMRLVWETDGGFEARWGIIRRRMVTCIACLGVYTINTEG